MGAAGRPSPAAIDVARSLAALDRAISISRSLPIFSIRSSVYNIDGALTLPKFEDCLQQLEKIVEQLEKGDLPLEKSLQLFEEGVRLSNSCRQELEAAEGKVEILMKQGGKLQPEPFEAGKQAAGDGQ